VHRKNLWSDLLQRRFSIDVTCKAQRTIDKYGGLDNYILCTPEQKLVSVFGMKLKKVLREAFFYKHGTKFVPKPPTIIRASVPTKTRKTTPKKEGAKKVAKGAKKVAKGAKKGAKEAKKGAKKLKV